MLCRLRGMLAYSAEPIQHLLAVMPREDLNALPWLARFSTEQRELHAPRLSSEEETAFARTVFQSLGQTSLDGQLAHLEQCAFRAAELKKGAQEKADRSSKAYASMGVCAGLCVALLLL